MLNTLLNDESGFIVSAELILVLTIAVLSMVVGLAEVAIAVNTELNDLSNAFGAINQSFAYCGFEACSGQKMSPTTIAKATPTRGGTRTSSISVPTTITTMLSGLVAACLINVQSVTTNSATTANASDRNIARKRGR